MMIRFIAGSILTMSRRLTASFFFYNKKRNENIFFLKLWPTTGSRHRKFFWWLYKRRHIWGNWSRNGARQKRVTGTTQHKAVMTLLVFMYKFPFLSSVHIEEFFFLLLLFLVEEEEENGRTIGELWRRMPLYPFCFHPFKKKRKRERTSHRRRLSLSCCTTVHKQQFCRAEELYITLDQLCPLEVKTSNVFSIR